MSTVQRRKRHETAELPTGIGHAPPFPPRGPVTALRVLGSDLVVRLDPARAELRLGRAGPPLTDVQLPLPAISGLHAQLTRNGNALEVTDLGSKNGVSCARPWLSASAHEYERHHSILVNVGDRFALGSVELLALDEPTYALIEPLTGYCGLGAHDEVDHALASILREDMIVLRSTSHDDVLALARALHAHSVRKEFPCTHVAAVPRSSAAIQRLCSRAGCGTIVLDLRQPFAVPRAFSRSLRSTYFHLWTIVLAAAMDDVCACFGVSRWELGPHCKLGFPRQGWHRALRNPRFVKVVDSGAKPGD